ncbi:transporter substrate-binding domain-containing protein [Yoonia sediminilitoris]|uniref:Amino acid ABC transporter substrate-binding protein (PAAT family) n=1 Tax=Yoonia sediminilitoris TaxID=1286148 RepID=A0A2T6KPL9_9RHOB|nr:transporter substrate-binding domain-containing protein [Yoonia sediminilitoris]PUB18497.1 amino acid ABC transporter substrate-binding protein (PAAT family) [Yoonia sediminilitoris]RCW98665.1 amino acid ABC transporter substrate-binding protein (PAAT family) [Yoonia sediminilitoris]
MRWVFALLLWLGHASLATAQDYCPDVDPPPVNGTLKVGVGFVPPFVMGSQRNHEGLNIDLWKMIAACLDLDLMPYPFEEIGDKETLIKALIKEEIDVAIANIPISLAHEKDVDFTVPYFQAKFGVVVPDDNLTTNILQLLKRIFQSNILLIIGGLFGFMLVVATSYWWIERRNGNEFFTEGPLGGLYRSVIWATLLIFQGEGDPFELKSRYGQIFVLFLMFIGVTIISSFTAIITSSLTLQGLQPSISSIDDLKTHRVAVVADQEAQRWVQEQDIPLITYESFPRAQAALNAGELEGLLHDKEALQYMVNKKYLTNLKFAPLTIDTQNYAIALPQGSALREPINLVLLSILDSAAWQDLLKKFFGALD